ncbi:polysaccharide deacetylase family sporulation protein PdaB [Fonticella tunisiensis]|uniref:Polysaccharide deacetylase family sporulation protein PdaB n=1 Tax=Fonticella tunisiensis TaxID=1096341 RepID=A0A4R7KQW7_9CLOT|nr:polysaccharide deacetylase family sporulation protein PdaB [Fonticella tunisiensis]TDT61074.1 polysaccharide deacetylase family sporulation protein PdaB [Fonticella tunisiensis]
MKVFYVKRSIIINLMLVFCIVTVSVIYSLGEGFNFIDVLVNTRKDIPIYSVERNDKKIAISFDAAWGSEYTDEILKILEKNDVKATFFLVGSWVDKYPDQVRRIYDMGHEIGNHSATHPHFTQLDVQKMKEEIFITSDKIKNITGVGTSVFRPPFGDYNSDVVKAVKEAGHYCIQWDVDSLDWKNPGEEFIINRVTNQVGSGSIVLFHNNAEQTPKVLDKIIKDLKKKGYEFVKISELIYKENYYIDHTGRQRPVKQ